MAHRHKSMRRRSGGALSPHRLAYSGRDSAIEHEADETHDSFKRGGRYARGGSVRRRGHDGRFKSHHDEDVAIAPGRSRARADKRPRNLATASPFSSAARNDNDFGRTPAVADDQQPGAFHGSNGRPVERYKHPHNFGAHDGAGREEDLEGHSGNHHDDPESEDAGVRHVIHHHYHHTVEDE